MGLTTRFRLAIIGTAGRDPDHPMTRKLWRAMLEDVGYRIKPTYTLVSGGAAWADHLAVALFLRGKVSRLVLYLPAPFQDCEFQGPPKSAASAANYYHSRFSKVCGFDSLAQIEEARTKGATIYEQPARSGYSGMFARNAQVAKAVDGVLAYTFGTGDVPTDGGTKNTWDQITGKRVHVSLLDL